MSDPADTLSDVEKWEPVMITVHDVEQIARLAKLEFTDEEKHRFIKSFNEILSYVELLNELDLDGIEPTTHVVPLQNVLREDCLEFSLPREQVMQNAPEQKEGLFSVPKVIGASDE
jgi:aspartyl-tRNA(Asn)/glutamyl-tRNA(Gln) amidotransferase subunit C